MPPLAYEHSPHDIIAADPAGPGIDPHAVALSLLLASVEACAEGDMARRTWLARQAAHFQTAHYDIVGCDAD